MERMLPKAACSLGAGLESKVLRCCPLPMVLIPRLHLPSVGTFPGEQDDGKRKPLSAEEVQQMLRDCKGCRKTVAVGAASGGNSVPGERPGCLAVPLGKGLPPGLPAGEGSGSVFVQSAVASCLFVEPSWLPSGALLMPAMGTGGFSVLASAPALLSA